MMIPYLAFLGRIMFGPFPIPVVIIYIMSVGLLLSPFWQCWHSTELSKLSSSWTFKGWQQFQRKVSWSPWVGSPSSAPQPILFRKFLPGSHVDYNTFLGCSFLFTSARSYYLLITYFLKWLKHTYILNNYQKMISF